MHDYIVRQSVRGVAIRIAQRSQKNFVTSLEVIHEPGRRPDPKFPEFQRPYYLIVTEWKERRTYLRFIPGWCTKRRVLFYISEYIWGTEIEHDRCMKAAIYEPRIRETALEEISAFRIWADIQTFDIKTPSHRVDIIAG